MELRVGTRTSPLALKQIDELREKVPGVVFRTVGIETRGDKDKTTPLDSVENGDFFTHEIEQALLAGEIDVAVHSAKDLEENIPEELVTAAVTASISRFDCLVSGGGQTFCTLPGQAIVGTSSKTRKDGVLGYRNDLVVRDIRGDIDERLELLDEGDYDAVIVAQAALMRLGYYERMTGVIPFSIIEPNPLQGSLAVQVHRERKDLQEIFRLIDGK